MYRGVEAGITSTLVGGFGAYYAERYLDHNFPELGGPRTTLGGGADADDDDDDDELSDYEAFRRAVRRAIRGSVSSLVGVTISQPFTGEKTLAAARNARRRHRRRLQCS